MPGDTRENHRDSTRKTALQAVVDVVGVRRKVDLGLLQDDPPVPGDWVLIHVVSP